MPRTGLGWWVVVVAAAAVMLASGCVGSGKTPRAATLESFPAGINVMWDGTTGCRAGESGFDYRFMVVGPADLDSGSPLRDHIRSKNFYSTGVYRDADDAVFRGYEIDLPWATAGYQHRDQPLRIEAGMLDRYLVQPASFTGPAPEKLPAEVRDNASRYVLLAMRPTDFRCTTPL